MRSRAFTLVEILMVVVILGIASVVILPQIGSRDDLKVAAAARNVISDFTYAQNRAIALQRTHYVKFTSTGYTIYDAAAMATPVTHPVNKVDYTRVFNASGATGIPQATLVDWSLGGANVLAFDELGAPKSSTSAGVLSDLAADGRVRVRSGTQTLRIEVELTSGEMTVTSE